MELTEKLLSMKHSELESYQANCLLRQRNTNKNNPQRNRIQVFFHNNQDETCIFFDISRKL